MNSATENSRDPITMQTLRVTALQFCDALAQSEFGHVSMVLEVHFSLEGPFDRQSSKSCRSAGSLVPDVRILPSGLLDVQLCQGNLASGKIVLEVVVAGNSQQPSPHSLSDMQCQLLPLILASTMRSLGGLQARGGSGAHIQWFGEQAIANSTLAEIVARCGDEQYLRHLFDQIRDGPFAVSAVDRQITATLQSMFAELLTSKTVSTFPSIPTIEDVKQEVAYKAAEQKRSYPKEAMMSTISEPALASRGLFDPAPPISVHQRRELRKHVVNLNFGKFSTNGKFSTSQQDVNAIFKKHLKEWIDSREDNEAPIRVMLYAHGGLTTEDWGLHTAALQMDWWKHNGIYPIFFVWETGLVETLRQIFVGGEQRLPLGGARGAVSDWFDELEDRGWEIAARRLGGPRVWGGMKESARQSFVEGGDGREVLNLIAGLAKELDNLEVHAVGHSAGSIFLSYAAQAASEMKLPKISSMHFMAPAITCDLFMQTLKPLIGGNKGTVESLSLFTMTDEYELQDTVGPYDKSLLYLIHHALEPQSKTPILGLEKSLVGESEIATFFGLGGHRNNSRTEVVYSLTASNAQEKSRSESKTHGEFDNDPATMQSIARRILGVRNSIAVEPFPKDARLSRAAQMIPIERHATVGSPSVSLTVNTPDPAKTPQAKQRIGTRLALCIGIDTYAASPLHGCVHDSVNWMRWLENLGFQTTQLANAAATREAMMNRIRELFARSQPGDSVVIQYAGHGTQVDDISGDEVDGDSPGKDEALVPVDYLTNGLLLDDDLGELCSKIKEGVQVTLFMDCCHSGTNTRMFMRTPEASSDSRARYLPATPEMIDADQRHRAKTGFRSLGYTGKREVLFAACRSQEVAWESGGQGDFTRNAMKVLGRNPNQMLSHEEFLFAVLQEFGPSARQTPGLWCDPKLRSALLPSRVNT